LFTTKASVKQAAATIKKRSDQCFLLKMNTSLQE
jgi:hypothetical protein